MYEIVIGQISAERKANWHCASENPYAVWSGERLVSQACTAAIWRTADHHLRDHMDVDWGSIAWKATKQELTNFFTVCNWNTAKLYPLKDGQDYAVVFLESAGEF